MCSFYILDYLYLKGLEAVNVKLTNIFKTNKHAQ